MTSKAPYHHGNLARVLLDAAADVIGEVGPAQMSLREVARRSGVSNAAPIHHFGDKRGLFTALAAEGFTMLAERLRVAREATGEFLEVGVAYVRFATEHRAHFDVMFRRELFDADAPEVVAAMRAAAAELYGPAGEMFGERAGGRDAGIFAWSLVHGLSTLILTGNLGEGAANNPARIARRIARLMSPA